MKNSLKDFAKDFRTGCFMCRLPASVREEVDEAIKAGDISRNLIIRWLHERGYSEATRNNFDWHKYNHVIYKPRRPGGLRATLGTADPPPQTGQRPRKAAKK